MSKELEADGFHLQGNRFIKGEQVMLPLYEAKMIHHFDHRYGDYHMRVDGSQDSQLPDVPLDRLKDTTYEPLPRYWVPAEEVEDRLRKTDRAGAVEWSWPHDWLLGWRDITNSTNERTVIATVIPRVAVGNKLPLMLMTPSSAQRAAWLVTSLSSFAHDFAARQKIGGTAMNFFIYKQLPVLPPSVFEGKAPWSPTATVASWIEPRACELLVTSNALLPFGKELAGISSPFAFDPVRRFHLRCELDAAFFHLYALSRDEVAYVMETFPIVRRHDEKEYGDYRTKLVIMDVYDAMAEASRTSKSYQPRIDQTAADRRLAHAPGVLALPPMPALVPQLAPGEEAAIVIWALLYAAGGKITRVDLARAFVLRSHPSLLRRLAPSSLSQAAEWAARVSARVVAEGLLVATLRQLQERGGVTLSVSADSQSVVSVSPNTPPEDRMDPWFRFEARLALQVLRAQATRGVEAVDGTFAGDDRSLLERAS
jgi:hypothetical protein